MVKNLLQQVVGEDNKLGTAREEMNELIEKINSGYCTLWGCFSTYEEALEEVEHRLANDGKP